MDNIINTLTKAISLAVIAVVAKEMTKAIELDWQKNHQPTNYGYDNPYANYGEYHEHFDPNMYI